MGAVAEHLQRAQPDIELIEFTGGDPPPGLAADVFFGGYFAWDEIARWIDAAGVRWVQVSGTGVDKVPRRSTTAGSSRARAARAPSPSRSG